MLEKVLLSRTLACSTHVRVTPRFPTSWKYPDGTTDQPIARLYLGNHKARLAILEGHTLKLHSSPSTIDFYLA